jgi:hypothetical protein
MLGRKQVPGLGPSAVGLRAAIPEGHEPGFEGLHRSVLPPTIAVDVYPAALIRQRPHYPYGRLLRPITDHLSSTPWYAVM